MIVVHARRAGNWRPPRPPEGHSGFRYAILRRLVPFRDWALRPKVRWQPIDPRVRMVYVPELSSLNIPDGDAIFATTWQEAEHLTDFPASKGQGFYLVMDFDPWLAPKDRLEATWRLPLKKVTVSNWLLEKVCHAGGARNDTVNIPNGIDHQRFRLTGDIGRRRKRVAMLYHPAEHKGSQDGLRALEIAKSHHPDLEATLFGQSQRWLKKPPAWVELRSDVSEPDLVGIYNACRIYVCSSLAEGFALPPAEAMACGCAVVATDCGGIREFACHGVNALLSPPRNAQALAASILELLADDSLRVRLAKSGYERIQEFTWERSATLLEQFLKEKVQKSL